MGHLVYGALTSLDGYVNDSDGEFGWAAPDEEEHAFVNDLQRDVGTHLYGRRLYEVMTAWETMPTDGEPAPIAEYKDIWRAADKVVYSATLDTVTTERTRMERTFDPDAVRRLVADADGDVTIGGASLAGAAFTAGLVDRIDLFVHPVVVGGGTRALPDGVRLDLVLASERRFASGVVHLGYRAR